MVEQDFILVEMFSWINTLFVWTAIKNHKDDTLLLV
jgi:hypothetical protein